MLVSSFLVTAIIISASFAPAFSKTEGKVALPKNPAIFGKVSDYVNCPEDISDIKNFLFGDCLLVSKIDELDESILNEWNCVDMEGHISNRGIIKFKDSEDSLIQIP